MMSIVYGPKWSFYSCCNYHGPFGTGFMQVMYLGRAPRTKETLLDFLKWRRVTRHPLVFRGLTGSQPPPGFRASHNQFVLIKELHILFDSLATMLRNCRRPKGSSTGCIFFYFENSVNIRDI